MDVGIWMRPEVLEHKLEARNEKNPEQVWQLSRWPSGYKEGETNRLFIASEGAWRGYFILSEGAGLHSYRGKETFTMIFDTRTWTKISPIKAKRFRGFTYRVPKLLLDGTVLPPDS
jgi:hypothetical protein